VDHGERGVVRKKDRSPSGDGKKCGKEGGVSRGIFVRDEERRRSGLRGGGAVWS